jgi:CubicO group peptidase (beta-lactamase class C family)
VDVSYSAADGLARTSRFVEAELDAGLLMTAAQVCAVGRDARVHEFGRGEAGCAVDETTIFRAYCALKPIVAIAVAQLVEQGCVDLDEPLARVLQGYEALDRGPITLRHVLNHTAGLHDLSGFQMELLDDAKRDAVLRRLRSPLGWRLGVDVGYGEVGGWYLIGRLIAATTGQGLRSYLRTALLDPLGMHDTYIGMTPDEYDAIKHRIGLNCDMRRHRRFPMLIERTRRTCTNVNCAYGGYTTAHDLAGFYARVLGRLKGNDDRVLPSQRLLKEFCSNARPPNYDVVLERQCGYGLGFMVNLRGHHFGEMCAPTSFGHAGWLGATFGFADPENDIACAAVLNGVTDRGAGRLRQPALVDAIYADMAAQPCHASNGD